LIKPMIFFAMLKTSLERCTTACWRSVSSSARSPKKLATDAPQRPLRGP
jgi:hypothetical protein